MEFKLDVAQQALAASGEACRTAGEEVSRLIDERVSLLVEIGLAKRSCLLSAQRSLKRKRPWRQNMMLALKPSSITDRSVAPLRIIFGEVSLRFQKGCRAHQSH